MEKCYTIRIMESHYYKTKLVKMGKWALLPVDTETWFSEDASRYFKEAFGLPKILLIICNIRDGFQHVYVPVSYFQKMYARIRTITDKDYKKLEKILEKFYILKKQFKKEVPMINPKNLTEISNRKLVNIYSKNRDWVHRATIYDQFGWLGEDYWKPLMDEVLVHKLKIAKDSSEYHRVLFVLTAPEEISTTLEEKRAVLKAAIAVKNSPGTLQKESDTLSDEFGWMPVFAYGEAWTTSHYAEEVKKTSLKELSLLKKEHLALRNYTALRNKKIKEIISKYRLNARDLQFFIDFGLALDGRNEAEYLVSFAGYYLMFLYHEIARRLRITERELRTLFEKEIIACLLGKTSAKKLISNKGTFVAIGSNNEIMSKRANFLPEKSEKLFKYIEGYVKNVQGNTEHKGVCASSGKATGKVRIVATPKENHKVEEGDILITHATTVDYLPAMKNAAAIVTEVGGLTCHAAVVSREFGIPCVVALKNAMKNFKDGDMVEVDADKGTVRKL